MAQQAAALQACCHYPAAGFVTVVPAVLIGLIGGVLCFAAVAIVKANSYDDALDAFGVHGVGGTWGALATGLWATKTANSAGADGLFTATRTSCMYRQ